MRDIFRIHPDTGCNTHDLLQCPCGAENEFEDDGDKDAWDDHDHETRAADSDSDLDGEFDIHKLKGFTAASQMLPEQANKIDKAVTLFFFSFLLEIG